MRAAHTPSAQASVSAFCFLHRNVDKTRKSFAMTSLLRIALSAFLFATAATAFAAPWQPTRNVEIVVSTSPGSGSDTTARFIQKLLIEKQLVRAPVTVINKPGGQGVIGLTYLSQHAADGHYVMVTSPSLLANQITGRSRIGYRDTTPLAQLGTEAVVFTVRTDSPMRSGRELADTLKANPASLSFSIGTTIGSHNHIAIAQLAKALGLDPKPLKVIAFGGSADGITALLGGHISVVASPTSGVWEHASAGKLRMLAISSDRRQAGPLASVPTWKELGYPVVSANWRSIVGPKGMPQDQVQYWDGVFSKLAHAPEWKQSVDSEHMENTYSDSRGTLELMDAQYKAMASNLTDLGLAR
jgi:putative tricarboxylic transport membrane protein